MKYSIQNNILLRPARNFIGKTLLYKSQHRKTHKEKSIYNYLRLSDNQLNQGQHLRSKQLVSMRSIMVV
jgi:hypothetical protein